MRRTMIATGTAAAATLALTGCGGSNGNSRPTDTGTAGSGRALDHSAVELYIERTFDAPMTDCNDGVDVPLARSGQTFRCVNPAGTYLVTIKDPVKGTYTVTPPSVAGSSTRPTSNPIEGSAESTATYRDGASVSITKALRVARASCADASMSQTCVLIRATLKNDGAQPIPLRDSSGLDLFYGPNRFEADQDSGYTDDPNIPDRPQRVVPGSSIVLASYFDVPTAQLGVLTLQFSLPTSDDTESYPNYTFTGIDSILK